MIVNNKICYACAINCFSGVREHSWVCCFLAMAAVNIIKAIPHKERAAVRAFGNLLNNFLSLMAQVKEFLCKMTE